MFSQRGREDLRGQLAAMRKLAWRLGWLDRSIDPLDGWEIGRANVLHGATAQYVDPRLRPETHQVKAMATAADLLCGPDGSDPRITRLRLFGTKIRVAGFGGLRLGKQNALRAIDVSDVMARYGWGKTKGYQNLKNRSLVPAPVMTHPDRWRLDQLLGWEEKRMELAEAALDTLVARERTPVAITDLLPQPKRRRRSA